MNTPETDQWEAYCDECYYHMWRLRRKTERGWHDGFHINKGDEAKGLCDLLNNLERERDEWKAKYIQQNKDLGCELRDPNGTIWDHAKTLQRERDEARGQRDRLLAALKDWSEIREWLEMDSYIKGYMKARAGFFNGLDEALQSLTPNAKP